MAQKKDNKLKEIRNAKVGRDFFVGEKYEAGIVLTGTEIKSIRQAKAQINDSFVRLDGLQALLYNANISEYDFGNINNHLPNRPRKLLLHKKEILKLKSALESKGKTIIPTKIYFKKALAKIEIAVCTGKKLFDKRDDLKKKVQLREAQRDLNLKNS